MMPRTASHLISRESTASSLEDTDLTSEAEEGCVEVKLSLTEFLTLILIAASTAVSGRVGQRRRDGARVLPSGRRRAKALVSR